MIYAALGCLTFFAGLRLWELARSAANSRSMGRELEVVPDPIWLPMFVLHVSFFVLPVLEWLFLPRLEWMPVRFSALTMTLFALSMRVWVLRTLGRSWNVRVVSKTDYPIVTAGPYRWIRHPNYLVVILELAFVPLIFGLWRSAVILSVANAVVLFFRIRLEERVLSRHRAWLAAFADKARFVPGLF